MNKKHHLVIIGILLAAAIIMVAAWPGPHKHTELKEGETMLVEGPALVIQKR